MNKIQVVLLSLAFVAMAFTVGYKVGDSRGYNDGYIEGYLYDCKDEIAALYDQVKSQKKVTEYAQQSIQKTLRENDSLRYVRRADSVNRATGRQLPSYDSVVKKNLASQREQINAMREMMKEGKIK